MIDEIDREVIAQLGHWADHLAAQVPATDAAQILTSPIGGRPRRTQAWSIALVAAAAAVLIGMLGVGSDHRIAPAPAVDTTPPSTEVPPSTSVPVAPVGALPLGGTQWAVQRGSDVLILELQRLKDGNGIVVGQIGKVDIEGGCTAVDGTVRADGSTIVFSSLSADTGCEGAPEFLAALTAARTFSRSGDSRIVLFDGTGGEVLHLDGYSATTFAPTITESDLQGPPAPLAGLWHLDFSDSGLSSAVFLSGGSRQNFYQILLTLDVDEFRPGRVFLGAGVAGGCFEASAPYTVDADVLTFGIFDAAVNHCGPEVLRLMQHLVGQQRFTIHGQVLEVAGFRFLRTRPADRSTAAPTSTLPFGASTVPLVGTWHLNSDASGFGPTGLDQAPTATPPIDAALTIASTQPNSASTAFTLRLSGGRVADCSLGTSTMTVTASAADSSRGTVKVDPFVDASSTSTSCGAEIGVVRERLVGATDFDIRGRVLTIYDALGRASLVFVEP